MVVIQRIRVVWRQDERGAAHAGLRRNVPRVLPLPDPLPEDAVVVHDVVADSSSGYRLSERVLSGTSAAAAVPLELTPADDGVTMYATGSGAVYPRGGHRRRLFTVAEHQVGLYHANFRFMGCACSAQWWYEDWTVRVGNAAAHPGLFLERTPRQVADHRVSLYGGRPTNGAHFRGN
ncbi:hypothetical protein CS0771_29270 [Catellatospora sp. IY07-71]|uniref:hypothetical protein n=1 Tax=Catellatospora sp. IY07-71 TaxID=2728827 RepID=UPI001BB3987E|nr:hypothetical protein [Catellatospora sp. IY07-71]BCJ73383.1 hypothetical protein CS0771_29270 [Catellatospora sp. IY07-71]